MAPPAAWRGPPVPHRPPEPPARRDRTAVVAALGVVAVIALAVGALVAFSGDDPPERASSTTGDQVAFPEPEPTTPTSQVVDEDLLSTLNVQKNDIGSSWQQVESGPLDPDAAGCQFPDTGVRAGHAVSYVLHPNGLSGTVKAHLTAVTTVFVDDQAAVAQEGVDGSDAHGECLRADGEDRWSVASSGTSPPGTIARQETGVTPPSLGWRYQTTLAGPADQEFAAYTDYVIVRRGRVRLALSMLSIDVPFDPVLKPLLIDRVAERVASTIKAAD